MFFDNLVLSKGDDKHIFRTRYGILLISEVLKKKLTLETETFFKFLAPYFSAK